MAITYTQYSLEKLEILLKSLNYKIRYEKGNFKTGACVLANSRVIVVNKFSTIESKINSLVGLLSQIQVDETLLDEKQTHFLNSLKQTALQL